MACRSRVEPQTFKGVGMTYPHDNIDRAFASLPAHGYAEPISSATLVALLGSEPPSTAKAVAIAAIERVAALEAALLPFAVNGGTMLHIRRLLDAEANRAAEPAGGVWITSAFGNVELIPCPERFSVALDVYGRASTRSKMLADVAVHAAVDERSEHEAAGGKRH